jgi:cyclopropane-fatty-acyl-phospholipid synthase
MITRLVSRSSSRRAADILGQVFGGLAKPFAFRLWDGTHVSLGGGAPAFTVVIHAPETFVRLVRDPSPLNFAEAFVESAIDIEGDLFAAMAVADAVEELRLPLARRLRILASMWRG